jgi:hypothetical protein
MVPNPQILSDFRLMRENHCPVELMNLYRGVPFVCKGRILEIEEDRVRVHVETAHIILLLNQRTTKVLGNDYFEPITAQIEDIDLPGGTVTLHHFSYTGVRLGDRMMVRVAPAAPIPALIETEDRPVLGEMVDISMNGMGVQVAAEHYLPILKPGANVYLSTTLPNGEINVHGTIISVTKHGDDYRLAVRFAADHDYKVIIYHYLVDRRAEIEAEVRRDYEQARREASQV